jgi:hypothetical protein
MSHLVEKRTQFKNALDSVEGVHGFLYQPSAPRAGDAWPVMGTAEKDIQSGEFYIDWYVAVYLPQRDRDASIWIDNHVDLIIDAIEEGQVATVDQFDPVNLGDDTNFRHGLALTMRSE